MKTVLVVEDNRNLRANLVELLGLYDLNVIAAADGEQALTMARAYTPDFILCDVDMPKMNGIAFLHAIKTDAELRHIDVAILSAYPSSEIGAQMFYMGATAFFRKPDDIRRVAQYIKRKTSE